MPSVKRFEDLDIWRKSRMLASDIYTITRTGPFAKDFILRDQIRRAALSIASNIAEGFERGGSKEFMQFLAIAKGSSGELRAHLYLALDQNYLTQTKQESLAEKASELGRMIGSLITYLSKSSIKGPKYK